jgi:hypothetical protein
MSQPMWAPDYFDFSNGSFQQQQQQQQKQGANWKYLGQTQQQQQGQGSNWNYPAQQQQQQQQQQYYRYIPQQQQEQPTFNNVLYRSLWVGCFNLIHSSQSKTNLLACERCQRVIYIIDLEKERTGHCKEKNNLFL